VQGSRPAGELAIEDQEGQPAEVVTVQVRDGHGINRARIKALGLKSHQAGSAAVNQQHLPLAGQADARLPPPATTERVTTADKTHPHDRIFTCPAGT
jgi:hypothetical protein